MQAQELGALTQVTVEVMEVMAQALTAEEVQVGMPVMGGDKQQPLQLAVEAEAVGIVAFAAAAPAEVV